MDLGGCVHMSPSPLTPLDAQRLLLFSGLQNTCEWWTCAEDCVEIIMVRESILPAALTDYANSNKAL